MCWLIHYDYIHICNKKGVGERGTKPPPPSLSHLVPTVLTTMYYTCNLTSRYTLVNEMVIQGTESFFFVVPYAEHFHNFYFGSEGIFDPDA